MSDRYDINIYDEHGNKIGTGTAEREPSIIAQAVGLAYIIRIAFYAALGVVMDPIIALLFLIKHPKLGLLVLAIFGILGGIFAYMYRDYVNNTTDWPTEAVISNVRWEGDSYLADYTFSKKGSIGDVVRLHAEVPVSYTNCNGAKTITYSGSATGTYVNANGERRDGILVWPSTRTRGYIRMSAPSDSNADYYRKNCQAVVGIPNYTVESIPAQERVGPPR